MGPIDDIDAFHSEIDPPVHCLVQILRPIRGRFANAAPKKVPSNMSMFGIVR